MRTRGQWIRILFLCFISFVLSSCGSGSSSGGTQSAASGVSGLVFTQQGPVAGAVVTLKSYDGQLLGTANSNESGEFFIATTVAGPYMAQAIELKSGAALYSISANTRINITHLSDFMLRRWYEALSLNIGTSFAGLNSTMPAPEEGAMDEAVDQIAYAVIPSPQFESLNIFGDEISARLEKLLRASAISGNTISINMIDPYLRFTVTLSTEVNSDGSVIFSGNADFTTASLGTINPYTSLPNHAAFLMASYWKPISNSILAVLNAISPIGSANAATMTQTNIVAIVGNAHQVKNNEHWMSDYWVHIKDKKLSEIAIPGSHDSGTYKLGWGSGINTAKTQNVSLGQQLKDGIRYLDIRVTEAAHSGCADPSVWWLYHTWKSYRLQVGLDEIRAFVSAPANSKEVVILDFQDIAVAYNDARAEDVLLALIQSKLGEYMVTTDQISNWRNGTLNDFVSQGRRVIVLLPTSISTRVNAAGFSPGCGAKFDGKYFAPRGGNLRSYYAELETSKDLQEKVITPQLQKDSPLGNGLFDTYRAQQTSGGLSIIQIVPRPSNAWYVAASASLSWGYPIDLLTYGSFRINAPLNLKMSQGEVDSVVNWSLLNPLRILDSTPLNSYCASGWLGKRLTMGMQGDPARWNKPNILIVDNYNPIVKATQFNWVLPKYIAGRWVSDWRGGYVDFVIRLNALPRDASLSAMTGFSDDQCLP
jgi:hypothetical protein